MVRVKCLIFILTGLAVLSCSKQKNEKVAGPVGELPYTKVGLDDLAQWQTGGTETWKIVSHVSMDRALSDDWKTDDGKGVLLLPGKSHDAELISKFNHQDIDFKCEFMLSSKGAASIFLQGHYQLRLTNSWDVNTDTSEICGVITNSVNGKPVINACKAPGLWQTLLIRYKAPRFSRSGKKISNAIIFEIVLNGIRIHKEIEISSSVSDEEKAAPLKIVGHSGPLAFRNIEYKAYNDQRITLKGTTYRAFKGLFREYDTLQKLTPVRTGSADSLHWKYGDKRAQIAFDGKVEIPIEGQYLFRLRAGGPAWILIDENEVVNNKNTRDYTQAFTGNIQLTKGEHKLSVVYANYDESLVVEYAGPGIPLTPLTVHSSERKVHPVEPLELTVRSTPVIQRGFLTHQGKVNRYAISVGTPSGINYAYDLTTLNLLTLWRGQFLDVSNMWVERGEPQLQIPLGATLELVNTPALLDLTSNDKKWVDTVSVDENIYAQRGYRINERGLPVFMYSYQGNTIEDYVDANDDVNGIQRTITVNFDKATDVLQFLLGRGKQIESFANGDYAMNDQEYYIRIASGTDANQLTIVESEDGTQELRLLLNANAGQTLTFKYSLIW
jgi:hypothetical protein